MMSAQIDLGEVLLAGASPFLQDLIALLTDSVVPVRVAPGIAPALEWPSLSLVIADASALGASRGFPEGFDVPLLGAASPEEVAALPPGSAAPVAVLDPSAPDEDLLFQINGFLYGRVQQRKYPRVLLRLPLEYAVSGLIRESICTNMSEGGIFILALALPGPDSPVSINLQLADGEEPLELTGKVVYRIGLDEEAEQIGRPGGSPVIGRPGFAVEFGDLAEPARQRLRGEIERHLQLVRSTDGREYAYSEAPMLPGEGASR